MKQAMDAIPVVPATLPLSELSADSSVAETTSEKMTVQEVREAINEVAQARIKGTFDSIGEELALKEIQLKSGLSLATLRKQLAEASTVVPPVVTIEPGEITEDERELAKTLAHKPDLFKVFHDLYTELGLPCKQYITDAILMMLVARLLDHSTGHVFVGPSSSGKSELPKRGMELLDPTEIVGATSVSTKALYYLGDVGHKVLALGEIKNNTKGQDDDEVQMAARQLISDNRLVRQIVEPQEDGPPKMREIVTTGPATFTFSTTSLPDTFCDELVNRCYWIPADDSPETTAAVLKATSRKFTREGKSEQLDCEKSKATWRAFFKCQDRMPVLIPFAEQIEPSAVHTTARRLHNQILDYVQISALLHAGTRETEFVDGILYIVATKADYEKAYSVAERTVPRPAGTENIAEREDLLKLRAKFTEGLDEFGAADAERVLGVSRRSANRKLEALFKSGKLNKTGGKAGQRALYSILQKTTEQQLADDSLGLVHPSMLD